MMPLITKLKLFYGLFEYVVLQKHVWTSLIQNPSLIEAEWRIYASVN